MAKPTVLKRIAHRKLRNNSGAVSRAAQSGDTDEITGNGVVVAMLVAPQTSKRLPEPVKPATVKRGWEGIQREARLSPLLDGGVGDLARALRHRRVRL